VVCRRSMRIVSCPVSLDRTACPQVRPLLLIFDAKLVFAMFTRGMTFPSRLDLPADFLNPREARPSSPGPGLGPASGSRFFSGHRRLAFTRPPTKEVAILEPVGRATDGAKTLPSNALRLEQLCRLRQAVVRVLKIKY